MQEDTGEVQTGIYSKIKGVLWGAVLGDVIGAFLEFSPNINEKRVNEAFSIKGGGQHKLQPGQPTDDSELAYSIAKGLIRGKGKLNLDFIAEQMGNWFMSKPIDIGGTIRKSVPKACNMKSHQAYLCRKAASQGSKQSQSNGTLMSIAPVAVWCHRLGPADIVRVVREYTILVHPNQLVVLANTFYTLMVVYLVNSEEVSPEAKTKAFLYAQQNIKLAMDNGKEAKQFLTWIEAIQEGLNEKTLLQTVSPVKNSGWVRVAFSYSIYQLLKGNSFRSSIFDILQLKGDTDTNACIAGGLLGAYYGFSGLQMEEQIAKINKWRPGKARRPDWLVPGLVIDKFVEDVIKCAPRELEIVGGELQK